MPGAYQFFSLDHPCKGFSPNSFLSLVQAVAGHRRGHCTEPQSVGAASNDFDKPFLQLVAFFWLAFVALFSSPTACLRCRRSLLVWRYYCHEVSPLKSACSCTGMHLIMGA